VSRAVIAAISVAVLLGLFLCVAELLGQDNAPTAAMAAEYKELAELSGQPS